MFSYKRIPSTSGENKRPKFGKMQAHAKANELLLEIRPSENCHKSEIGKITFFFLYSG